MQERVLSLDFFRGVTVAAMITVNNPGSWSDVYAPLLHAEWNGCTPTDLIFPFFLFIVGVSIHFAYREKKTSGLTRSTFIKIAKRSIVIFLLGMLVAWFTLPLSRMVDLERLATLRIPGVLQRIRAAPRPSGQPPPQEAIRALLGNIVGYDGSDVSQLLGSFHLASVALPPAELPALDLRELLDA
ncbi:MAG: heparan-alpha-glucosaminide N-acetyltransferase domain-containing protein, partial [Cyclobacteriaceae bacterium]|nr:heparan-alpha-glucosaminide N-acetyltransferase domain-containing protein [Cyclobacteriaceae bacterium]